VHDLKKNLKKTSNQARVSARKSAYETPTVTDYGDVTRLTQQKGTIFDGTHAQGALKNPYG